MNTTLTKPKKEEDGDKAKSMSTKAPLTERLMKKAAIATIAAACALVPVSCLLDREGLRGTMPTDAGNEVDAQIDAGPDTDVDADTDSGGPTDAGPDTDSGDLDSGPDLDADVSDGDVEEDADPEPLCSDIFDEAVTEETFDKGTGREVGGYMITYVSQTTGGLTLDIDCGSDSSSIASGESLTTLVEHTVEVPDDGKRIRITVHSRNTFDASMSVAVEPL